MPNPVRRLTTADGSPLVFAALTRIQQLLQAASEGGRQAVEASQIPTAAEVSFPVLEDLCTQFHLSPFERDLLLMCVGMELEPQFAILCGQASGQAHAAYPTLALALAILPNPHFRVLSAQSPLQEWQMIEVGQGVSMSQAPLKIDPRILCYLLEEPGLGPKLAPLVQRVFSGSNGPTLPPSHQRLAEQIATAWVQGREEGNWPIIQLCGTDVTTKVAIAAVACARVEYQLMQLAAELIPTDPEANHHLLKRWCREACLVNSALLLKCDGLKATDSLQAAAIAQFCDRISTPLVISTLERLPQRQRPLLTYDIPSLTHLEQLALWQQHLDIDATSLNGQLDAIAAQFNLSSSAIEAICLQANQQRAVDSAAISVTETSTPIEASGPGDHPLTRQLWEICRRQARPRLDDLAQHIETQATWEDLVLPEVQKTILQDIAAHVRQRATVYEGWQFSAKSQRGLGISALFAGASGTGKTLAAEVLANALNLDLYRIDLSAVVSKYIGETEKNLRRVFDAAETGGAILLFDEADALFGKRSDVKDSHDRHANIEVSYLLQRMEAYRGLAILTTNLREALDQAFLRRIRFVLEFPFPDREQRTEIWRRVFPAAMPRSGLDAERLAQLNVAGGNIRNIALYGAFLAADAGEAVEMKHLLQAARREYTKIKRLMTRSELEGWPEE